jgi:hypothetical protein
MGVNKMIVWVDKNKYASRRRCLAFWHSFIGVMVLVLLHKGADVVRAGHGLEVTAGSGSIKDVVTDLFGSDGITLGAGGPVSHAAHFSVQSLQGLDSLNSALVANLGFASFNSVVTGFTLNLETGEPERITESLGPLLAESATTLGQNKLNLGFTFTRSKFDRLNGQDLNNITLIFQHPDTNGDGVLAPFVPFPMGPTLDFELDEIHVALNLGIKQEVYAIFATYGVTEQWDVGMILPIVYIRVSANATAGIFDPTPLTASPHFFDPVNGDENHSSITRSKTGIGDVVLRTKYNILRDDDDGRPDMALGGQIVLPTGDADNLLGTGETRLQAVLILSKAFEKITPHANLGYEWVPNDHKINNLRYIFGFDVVALPELTVALDILGRWEHSGDDTGDHVVDIAVGVKWSIANTLLLNCNFQFPLNQDEGLRADVIWTVGVEHTY